MSSTTVKHCSQVQCRTSIDNNYLLSLNFVTISKKCTWLQQQTMEKYSCGQQKPALEKALLKTTTKSCKTYSSIRTVFSTGANKWDYVLQQAMKAEFKMKEAQKTTGCTQEGGMWTLSKVVLEIGSSLKSWTECKTWLVLVKETALAQVQSFSNKFTGIDQNTVRSFSMCLTASQLFSTERALRRKMTYDDYPSHPIQSSTNSSTTLEDAI